MKRTIWTTASNPFVMGGSVHTVIATEVKASKTMHDVGKGVRVFTFKTPLGALRVCESVTGAIIGDSVDAVRSDVSLTTKAVIGRQIRAAKEQFARAEMLTNEDFFKRYKK